MKTVVITGANSGIGKESAILEAEKGNRLFLICRNETKGKQVVNEIKELTKNDKIELVLMDLSEKTSIKNGTDIIRNKAKIIDVLIHNAAIFDIGQKKAEFNSDNVETIFFTNFLGPVLLTKLLKEALDLSDDPRVIAISSKGLMAKPFLQINYENPEYKGLQFSVSRNYYQAKLALCTWTQYMAAQNQKVTYNAIRVPSVKVDINRYTNISKIYKTLYTLKASKALAPKEMAETYVYAAEDSSLKGITGKYFNEKRQMVKMPPTCYKIQEWKKLYKVIAAYLENFPK
jgi:NAD(P)-dependent dehydrogenase (short-subunit alcohol dehydrogenase family)